MAGRAPVGRGDHPRIRGEHYGIRHARHDRSGSSPHTRGALLRAAQIHTLFRIIPAYAGSTQALHGERRPRRDHPRIRGEHAGAARAGNVLAGSSPHTRGARHRGASICTSASGSSPHTRGAPLLADHRRDDDGIIPAYAGSTWICQWRLPLSRDHPRIRGEHVGSLGCGLLRPGSSPHTRGALDPGSAEVLQGRIIPAYAGSTTSSPPPGVGRGDHPRIRGEHRLFTEYERRGGGSSPHTRGAPTPSDRTVAGCWIIPAYAGSTLSASLTGSVSADHPRIRGEHVTPASRCLGVLRIIPAYAGSTRDDPPQKRAGRDHPRIRGEHLPF